ETRVYNNEPWALTAASIPVQPGETWTFTAVVAGRFLGDLSTNAGGFISVVASNESGVVNWVPILTVMPQGIFGWTKVSVQYTVPSNGTITRISPRFFGEHGGGELYVADACVLPSTNVPNL